MTRNTNDSCAFPTLLGLGQDPLLPPKALAERLGVSVKTLERWRLHGEGPPFVRVSRKVIRYRASDVDAFIRAVVMTSTVSAC